MEKPKQDRLGQILLQQPLGDVIAAEDAARARHQGHEFEQQFLDRGSVNGSERRHHGRNFAQFVVLE